MTRLDAYYFFLHTWLTREGGANLMAHGLFTQPFETGAWRVGQGAPGWVYDSVNKLAINDGTFTDTQYLYQEYPGAVTNTTKYLLRIEVVGYPGGGGNFGDVTIYCLGYSLLLTSTPGVQEWDLESPTPPGGLYFLVNGKARLAIKEVIIRAL